METIRVSINFFPNVYRMGTGNRTDMNYQMQIRFSWPIVVLLGFILFGTQEWQTPLHAGTVPTGRIRVFLETEPVGSTVDFAFEAGGNQLSRTFSLADGERRRLDNLPSGSGYYVQQSERTGWRLKSATCSNGSPINNIRVGEGEVVTCTFVNEKLGTIVVQKVTNPITDVTTTFDFVSNVADGGALSPTTFPLRNGEQKVLAGIVPGNRYQLSETAKAGWELSTATCADGSPITSIDVEAGETVTCIFSNTKQGKLIIRKITEPTPDGTDTLFSFTTDSTLNPNSFGLKSGQTQTFEALDARAGYRVRELAIDHWQVTSSTCSNGSPTTNIRIDPGATTTCTFRNAGTLVDLHLTKEDGGVTAEPGDTIVYTLRYRNDGTQTAADVSIREQVPAHTVFIGPDGWSCAANAPAGTLCHYAVGNLSSMKSGQVQFKVKVNDRLPSNVTSIQNVAQISYAEAPNVDQSSTQTAVKQSVGLNLSKDDEGATAEPGGTVLYTLSYSNEGNQAVTNVVITETVPLYTTFAGPSALWSCPIGSAAGTICIQSFPLLASKASGTSAFSVKVVDMLPANVTMIENRARIGSATAPNVDTGTEQTELRAAPNLAIDLANENETAMPGGLVRYRLTFANLGTQGATNVVITKNIPTYTAFHAASSSNGWVCASDRCTYTAGTLASGAGNSINFSLMLGRPLPAGTASIINSASIHDDGMNGTDVVAGNNTAQITTPIEDPNTIVATKRAILVVDANNDGEASPRDTLEYVITLHNQRGIGVRNVNLLDSLDESLYLASGITTTQGTIGVGTEPGDPEVQVNFGTLAGDSTAVVRFRVGIQAPLPATINAVSNQGRIESRELPVIRTDDPNTPVLNDPTVTPLNSRAQLEVLLSDFLFVDQDRNSLVSIGDTLIYRLRLRNSGNGGAPALQLRIPIAENAVLVKDSVTTSAGTVREGNNPDDEIVRIEVGEVAGGAEVNISFQVQILDRVGFSAIEHQAAVITQSTNGAADITSDDPDTVAADDATKSILNQGIVTVRRLYLPVIQK